MQYNVTSSFITYWKIDKYSYYCQKLLDAYLNDMNSKFLS